MLLIIIVNIIMDLNNVDIVTNYTDKCTNFDDLNINDNLKEEYIHMDGKNHQKFKK